jgi:hypothetical protein
LEGENDSRAVGAAGWEFHAKDEELGNTFGLFSFLL